MSSDLNDYGLKIVGLLLIVELVSGYFLWTLNAVNEAGEAVFAILLAVDLVSLAMISYVYRTTKSGEQLNRGVLLVACCMILVFVYASLAL
jgi:heme/copper-type cytochrome/quinol oxidase subunit 4